jgi:hypothetical protein
MAMWALFYLHVFGRRKTNPEHDPHVMSDSEQAPLRFNRCFSLAVFAVLVTAVGCKRTVDDLDSSVGHAVLAYTVFQYPGNPCELVQKAAFTYGILPDLAAGTASAASRLMLMSPTRGTIEIQKWEFDTDVQRHPGSKLWFELVRGRVAELSPDDQLVVESVMSDFKGIELKDAAAHSNWMPMGTNIVSKVQPVPGHAATECQPTPLPQAPSKSTSGLPIY